jgi:putative peptidoglycan lipid II flippase
LAADLSAGLRLIICLSLPAAVGLMLLAEPLARLVLEHGAFDATDVARTAATTCAFAAGVTAYCALPLLLRGFYAMGDARRPLYGAAGALAINAVLDIALAWPLGEAGMALATAVSSLVQLGFLCVVFSSQHARLAWRELGRSVARTSVAAAALGATVFGVSKILPDAPTVVLLAASTIAGGAAFLIARRPLGGDELVMIWSRSKPATDNVPRGEEVFKTRPRGAAARQVSSLAP